MKTLKSWLGGAITITWNQGGLYLNMDGSIGGGKLSGILSGQSSLKLAAVQSIEGLGEEELNKLVPTSWLPVLQEVETFGNAELATLG